MSYGSPGTLLLRKSTDFSEISGQMGQFLTGEKGFNRMNIYLLICLYAITLTFVECLYLFLTKVRILNVMRFTM